jgi:hypothetical protein
MPFLCAEAPFPYQRLSRRLRSRHHSVSAKGVAHHDLTRQQGRYQDPLPDRREARPVHGPDTRLAGPQPGGGQGGVSPPAPRNLPDGPRARNGVSPSGVLVSSPKTHCSDATSATCRGEAASCSGRSRHGRLERGWLRPEPVCRRCRNQRAKWTGRSGSRRRRPRLRAPRPRQPALAHGRHPTHAGVACPQFDSMARQLAPTLVRNKASLLRQSKPQPATTPDNTPRFPNPTPDPD